MTSHCLLWICVAEHSTKHAKHSPKKCVKKTTVRLDPESSVISGQLLTSSPSILGNVRLNFKAVFTRYSMIIQGIRGSRFISTRVLLHSSISLSRVKCHVSSFVYFICGNRWCSWGNSVLGIETARVEFFWEKGA